MTELHEGSLDDKTLGELREIAARYPQARSGLLPMLHLVQSVDGRVSPAGIEACAEVLGITTAQVSGVATFYTMYRRRPAGKHHVGVCTTALCAVMGGDALLDSVQHKLGIGPDETTPDGTFSLGREGGHSERRIVHAKDATGREVERALLDAVRARAERITILERHMAVDLLQMAKYGGPDACFGAYVLDVPSGEVKAIVARPPADSRVKLEIVGGFGRPAFPTHPGTKQLYAVAEEFCGQIGAPLHAVVSPGGSDGSFAAALGVPTLDGLGPITHDTCSRNEYVEVSSIPQRGALLAGLIAATAAGRISAKA